MSDASPGRREATPTLATSQPALPAGVEHRYPAVVDSVGAARAAVTGWLSSVSADDLLIDDVAIAVSEACTNVVVHGYRDDAGGFFVVSAGLVEGQVRVTVSDDGCGMSPRPDSPGLGLGLAVIAALTDSFELRPGSEGGGTVVSMRFPADRAQTRPA